MQYFYYSQQVVLDENKQSRKYKQLYYVEFLEFLCRLGLHEEPEHVDVATGIGGEGEDDQDQTVKKVEKKDDGVNDLSSNTILTIISI